MWGSWAWKIRKFRQTFDCFEKRYFLLKNKHAFQQQKILKNPKASVMLRYIYTLFRFCFVTSQQELKGFQFRELEKAIVIPGSAEQRKRERGSSYKASLSLQMFQHAEWMVIVIPLPCFRPSRRQSGLENSIKVF